ncbi:MAG: hypothetical protein HEQ24_05055 [Dolichospermum sp. BR01]|nr:hypothetical protein [Dolichospermum sp. BR01]
MIGGFTLGGGGAYFQYIDDGYSYNDYVAAWGKLLGWTVGLKIGFDGNVSLFGAELPELAKANINNLWANLNNPYTAPAAIALPPRGSNGNDIINGDDKPEFIDAIGGNDVLNGRGGDDILEGGDGNDILNGGTGKNVLNGGAGNDTLIGGIGDDTYVFDADNWQGSDTINETIIALQSSRDTFWWNGGWKVTYAQATRTFWNIQQQDQNDGITDETKFTLINNGDGTIALKTYYDRFWSADSVGNITSSENINNWEKFWIENNGDGTIFLKNINWNTYVRANTTSITDARWNIDQSGNKDTWEKFTVINQNNNSIDTLDFAATTTKSINLDISIAGQQRINENLSLTLGITIGGQTFIDIENAVGGSLNDTLRGNNLNNLLRGNNGNDTLIGGAGNDALDGGAGNDILNPGYSQGSTDTVDGGDGNDLLQVDYSSKTDGGGIHLGHQNTNHIWNRNGGQILVNVSNVENYNITGTQYADVFEGRSGNDTFNGGAGNDALDGGAGNDALDGGAGNDILNPGYSQGSTDTVDGGDGNDLLQVDYTSKTDGGGIHLGHQNTNHIWNRNGGQILVNVSNVENYNITGTQYADVFEGRAGNDIFNGGYGNDLLTGGLGKDALTGGLGTDRFDYRNLADSLLNNFDVITDFNANEDKFVVSNPLSEFFSAFFVTTLDVNSISGILTSTDFQANAAARFQLLSFGFKNITTRTRTFVAINDGIAGFDANTDAIIEVTGLTGTLGLNNFTTTLA